MGLEGNKVYFPVESLTGLGHFNRTGKLVREMVKAGAEVTVASGSFVDPKRFFAGSDCRKIPQIAYKSDGNFYILGADGARTIQPEFNEATRKDERLQAHLDNVESVRPNIVITEFWPFDRANLDQEMKAVLEESKEAVKKGLRLVSVRDVLDTPYDIDKKKDPGVGQRHAERQAWAIEMINENFDAVLVHGDPNFIPLSETCPPAADIKIPVIYTGYVIDDLPRRTVQPGDRGAPVVVSCGSGVDGQELIFSFLAAWQKLLDRHDGNPDVENMVSHPVHIVCGPRFDPHAAKEVAEWADYLRNDYGIKIQVDAYRQDFTSVLASAAFSVSLAGYNTTLETLAMEAPALLVPKYGFVQGQLRFSTEQLYRLKRLHEKGFASFAHPYEVQDPRQFSELLVQEFTEQTKGDRQRPRLNFNGADSTIVAMEDLLAKKNAPAISSSPRHSAPKVPA